MRTRTCRRCGHGEAEHVVTQGPNSNGQFFHNLCGHDAKHHPPYVITACDCHGFQRQPWWRRWLP